MDFSAEPIKINLQGIFIETFEENIRFVSSDSYRASEYFIRKKEIKEKKKKTKNKLVLH